MENKNDNKCFKNLFQKFINTVVGKKKNKLIHNTKKKKIENFILKI
jgi:hypothetical protein